MKFKVGDKVTISKSSVYFPQQGYHGVGEIVKEEDRSGWMSVLFEDTFKDSYRNHDLELIKTTWKERFK